MTSPAARTRRHAAAAGALLAAVSCALCACGTSGAAAPQAPRSSLAEAASSSTSATPTGPPSGPTAPAASRAPAPAPVAPSSRASAPVPDFAASVSAVTAAQLGASWHAGCPVGPASLRAIRLSYWGFDQAAHTGTIVVNAAVVGAVTGAFRELYDARFPIRSIRPTADFGGSDPRSMDADNTSGFNCRAAVAPGPPRWSVHSYGEAIDVNTVENPYLEGGTVMPTAGRAYVDRGLVRPGMAVPNGTLVRAFASVGWSWGGRWSDPDYQHFSATGG